MKRIVIFLFICAIYLFAKTYTKAERYYDSFANQCKAGTVLSYVKFNNTNNDLEFKFKGSNTLYKGIVPHTEIKKLKVGSKIPSNLCRDFKSYLYN